MQTMNGRPSSPLPFFPYAVHRGQCRPPTSSATCASPWHRAHRNDPGLTRVLEESVLEVGTEVHEKRDEGRVVAEGLMMVGVEGMQVKVKTGKLLEVGATEELILAVGDEGIAGAELGAWKETQAVMPSPLEDLLTPDVSGGTHTLPKSPSYTKLSVIGKKGVCPRATP